MIQPSDRNFWQALSDLAGSRPVVIDRPKGKAHPSWPDTIYPLDYGYLEGTSTLDGGGIDVWAGSGNSKSLTGILCTFDILRSNAEVKLLLGCASNEVETIRAFHHQIMKVLYISNPEE